MATTRPFAYNTGSTVSATTQVGDLAIGTNRLPVSEGYGGLTWKNGPDEDLGYVIGYPQSGGTQPLPSSGTGFVQFWRSKIPGDDNSFVQLSEYISRKFSTPQTFANASDASIWLTNNGFWNSFEPSPTPTPTPTGVGQLINPILVGLDEYLEVGTEEYLMFVDPTGPTPTPSVTPTNTETPTPTPTVTQTETPTNTPTPSTTPIPVTGYGYNLVALPYNFPSSGNSILNAASPAQTGTTLINELSISQRGFYFNSIDNIEVDRTSHYSQFTGQSVSVTFTQNGDSAIYSGDSQSFKFWSGNTGTPPGVPGTGFVFGTNIGVPPSGVASGVAVLIQSATTIWVTGATVYVNVQSST
jgi:hypothetical protein